MKPLGIDRVVVEDVKKGALPGGRWAAFQKVVLELEGGGRVSAIVVLDRRGDVIKIMDVANEPA
ncbi:hypothetical protein SAMN02745857_03896 [Andreprevotia lacus DSM 23236]|jgi:hypothetical protein|uniref:Uncharacterized protein n=1 Tax=Andreprevotia lacus DSM 23236 TaxID=1121001 RepID=A0A1W1XZY3_9NEIS|nr:hypothetical protein [Andreprevotia lacus]SMC29529.1 hypothetical protein SAMN02745857_03896 [Andreprevotia lacus DSM 23236]